MTLKPKNDDQSSELTKNKASLEQEIKALKESDEQLQLVFDNMYETIVVAQDEIVKYCNA